MRSLFKLQILNSNSGRDLLHFHLQKSLLSSLSNSSKLQNSRRNGETTLKNHRETQNLGSLFEELTEILGSENLTVDKTTPGFSMCKETNFGNAVINETPHCREGVCENAKDHLESEKETQLVNLGENDVSPIVRKFTEILRAENGVDSMEELLYDTGIMYSVEIVDKVLKRCFKVPHLALRFFNWVKLRDGFSHTTETYNTMIYIAAEAKHLELVEDLVEEMEKNSCDKNIKTWTILITHYGNAKLIGKALLTFEKMKKSGFEPDYAAYKAVIRLLCVTGKAEIALEFYKEMAGKDMVLDMNLYKSILNCFAGSEDIATVQLVASDMMEVAQIPEHVVCACMLKSFCISGRIREALELVRDMKNKNITLDSENFETLVKGLCKADKINDALEIVDIMKAKTVVDAKAYGIIISAYLRRNDISKAFDLFHNIKQSECSPTTSTYTELIQHLFRLNEYQKACEVWNEMLEKGVPLDSVALTAIVAGHLHHNRISEAWEVFSAMEEKGIKATHKSYSVFIKELCKISRTDEIFKVLNKMQASNIRIADEIFDIVMSYMEKKGEMKEAEKVNKMQRACRFDSQEAEASLHEFLSKSEVNVELNFNRIEPETVETIDSHSLTPISKTFTEQDLKDVCRILSLSTDWFVVKEALEKCAIHFTPELVLAILRNCSAQGRSALQFFSWVGAQDGYRHTTETYNMAIKISGSGKDFKHMRSLFYEMRRNGCLLTSDTWTIMIMIYGRTGLTEIALRTFREMKASGIRPRSNTYKYLIVSLCGKKGRKVNEAIEVFQEMIRVGCVPDKELVETYIDCLCQVERLVDARRCIDSLRKIGFTVPLSYSLYIRALCRVGKLEEALTLLDEVGPDRHILEQYVYASLIHGLLKKGRLEEALAKIESMKQIGINPTVHVYTSLVVHFLKEKEISKASETFEEMKKEGCEPTVVTYSALIQGFVSLGKVDDAWSIFRRMRLKGPFPDFKTYSMFISCLCRVGRSEEALCLISEMLEDGIVPSTVNFRNVFHGLNREGKQDLAQSVIQKKSTVISRRKFST